MMTLAQASAYFDRTPAIDPFSGVELFLCQVDPFDESKRDAASAYRRVMSTVPGVEMPEHRSVRLLGRTWIVGAEESDGMQDLHRQRRVLVPADLLLHLSTLGEYLVGASSRRVYAGAAWNRDAKQAGESSESPPLYDVFTPEPAVAQSVLWNDSSAFLALATRDVSSGVSVNLCLKLPRTVEQMTVTTRTFSPVLGGLTVGAATQVPSLRVRWQSLFEYTSPADERYVEGDVSIAVPPGSSVGPADLLSFPDADYRVMGSRSASGADVLHARRI